MTSGLPDFPDLDAPHGDLHFLLGVLFNQQVRAETAWKAPARLSDRLGGLDVEALAVADPASLVAVMRERPTIHPFVVAMSARVVGICARLVDHYGARAANVWSDHPPADTLLHRLTGFPGIGRHKAGVALTLLIREYGIPIAGAAAASADALASCPRLSEILVT
ncbi:hypothetical protein [Actinomadura madurae]|uniref:hypothetical protein n=1 Tax=Actinomadura madurae TaxID=1993 RepID=UPI000D9E3EBB|nr:hypothetical protein [Actinomadura madurae]SPT51281.1 uncharacterized HhH-GPD family protein [Actinomadura madurae]